MREAVVNAIVHRDYSVAAPMQIRVCADRLSIWNPGELPESWSRATLLGPHPSQPYNPDIADAFFRAGEIEAWGRGIQRVMAACRQAGTPEPEIRVEARDFWFEFPFSPDYVESVSSGGTTQKTREKTREKVLRLIHEIPSITTKELAERVGITDKGIEWQLGKLRADGRIRRVGPDRSGHWEIVEEHDE